MSKEKNVVEVNTIKEIETIKPMMIQDGDVTKSLTSAASTIIENNASISGAKEQATVEMFSEMLNFFTEKLTSVAEAQDLVHKGHIELKELQVVELLDTIAKLKELHQNEIEVANTRMLGDKEYDVKVVRRDLALEVEDTKRELKAEFDKQLDEAVAGITAQSEEAISKMASAHAEEVNALKAEIENLSAYEVKYNEMKDLYDNVNHKMTLLNNKYRGLQDRNDEVAQAQVNLAVADGTAEMKVQILNLQSELRDANVKIKHYEDKAVATPQPRKKVLGLF